MSMKKETGRWMKQKSVNLCTHKHWAKTENGKYKGKANMSCRSLSCSGQLPFTWCRQWMHASFIAVWVYVRVHCQLFGGWYCRNTSFTVLCKFSMVGLLVGEYSQHFCITSYLYSMRGLENRGGGVAIMTHLSPPPSPIPHLPHPHPPLAPPSSLCLPCSSHWLWAKHWLLKSLSLSEKLRQFQSIHTVVGYPTKVKDLPAHHTKGPLWAWGMQRTGQYKDWV